MENLPEEVLVETQFESTIEEVDAAMSPTEIPGFEVAGSFNDLERGNVRNDSVYAYKITIKSELPIIAGGNLSRLRATLMAGGKLYVLKSIHAGNEQLFEMFFGKYESASGRCVVYEKRVEDVSGSARLDV